MCKCAATRFNITKSDWELLMDLEKKRKSDARMGGMIATGALVVIGLLTLIVVIISG